MESGSWKLLTREGLPIAGRPRAVYYRPHVIFNAATQLYVLWVNYQLGGFGASPGQYLTATSMSPAGPFKVTKLGVKLDIWAGNHGDFGLFVDDDTNATAFMIYTVYGGPGGPDGKGGHSGTTMTVAKLSKDYLGPADDTLSGSESSPPFPTDPSFAPTNAESPALFKAHGF